VSEAVILAGGRWQIGARRFAGPSRVISAFTAAEVVPALEAAESAAEDGSWAVGFVS
jgi:hypothetical protein